MNNDDVQYSVIQSYKLEPHLFDDTLSKEMQNSFSISHVNIRSLNKNYDNLNLLYDNTIKSKFDIIALSEVWRVSNKELLSFNEYTLEVKCRTEGSRGGGVGAYIHSSLKYIILDHEYYLLLASRIATLKY